MYLFAITFTDPSEPWGSAIEDRKLYRTPTEVVDAANAHFDAWMAEDAPIWHDGGACGKYGHYEAVPRTEAMERDMARYVDNYEGISLLDALVDEYGREYGIGRYELVG